MNKAVGKRILDCGVVGLTCLDPVTRVTHMPTSLHFRVARIARQTVGIDHAAPIVAELRTAYPRLDLRACDVEEVETGLGDEQPFELVILGDILEHLSNPGRALDGIRRVLVDDGEILVTCPNAFGLPNYGRFLFGRFREGPDHVGSYTKYTLTNLLKRHGFVVQHVFTCLDRTPRSRVRRGLYRLGILLLRVLPELGGTLLVVARRAPDITTEARPSGSAAARDSRQAGRPELRMVARKRT